MKKQLVPDFQSVFGSRKLGPEAEAKLRTVLTSNGFNVEGLAVDSGEESQYSYEIMMPHKTYTLSSLLNLQKQVESAAACEGKPLRVSITMKARKVGTMICFEFVG